MNATPFAIWPPPDSPVSAFSLAREMAALGQVAIAPPPLPTDAARGQGQSAIIIPGFFAPEMSTDRLRDFLTLQNFVPHTWVGGINLGPTRNLFRDLERQIDAIVDRDGQPVALVGISLGGTIARELAKRRPDKVARVITLLSPIRLPVISPLAPLAQAAGLLWDESMLGMMGSLLEAPPVPTTSVISRMDGVLDWRVCTPDSANADIVEINGPHMTVGSNPDAMRIIADRLARPILWSAAGFLVKR